MAADDGLKKWSMFDWRRERPGLFVVVGLLFFGFFVCIGGSLFVVLVVALEFYRR